MEALVCVDSPSLLVLAAEPQRLTARDCHQGLSWHSSGRPKTGEVFLEPGPNLLVSAS